MLTLRVPTALWLLHHLLRRKWQWWAVDRILGVLVIGTGQSTFILLRHARATCTVHALTQSRDRIRNQYASEIKVLLSLKNRTAPTSAVAFDLQKLN